MTEICIDFCSVEWYNGRVKYNSLILKGDLI